jgi:tetratricopeptide (TPR) repeat protein
MRFLYNSLFVLTLIGGGVAAWVLPGMGVEGVAAATPSSSTLRRQAIVFYERRLVEDPSSALDMAQLAALQMEEGRMTGDERAFVGAELLARRSLAERTRRNGRSAALLVNSLLAQHRFREALLTARDLAQMEPDEPAYRALLVESLFEVGQYDDAVKELNAIRAHREDLGIAPRFARWAELTGRVGEARRILRSARDAALQRADLTGEQRAWFSLRLADLELRHGNLRSAAQAISQGMKESPGDWRLLLARARLSVAEEDWRLAARDLEQVIATVPSPEAFALLATTRRSLGLEEEATAFEAILENLVDRPGALHRTWAFALLDRGRGIDKIITAVSADTLVRQDVHTLDLLAWALHRAGRTGEALAIVRRAVRTGTVEASLRYHAGMIEAIAGNYDAARSHLELALVRRGALSDAHVADIRQTLRTMPSASEH